MDRDQKSRGQFLENGYYVAPGIFSEDRLVKYRALVDDLINIASENSTDLFSNFYLIHRPDQGVLYDMVQRYPEFAALARDEKLLDQVAELYDENFFLYENSLVYKPKNVSNEVIWHQDFISRPNEASKIIIWIALDDVTEENGCLYVIPGSHKMGFLPWWKEPGKTHHTHVDLSYVPEEAAIPVTMKAGDVLIFHQLLLHSSKRVNSEAPRRAFRIAVLNFESSVICRGAPIVLRLGNKEALRKPYRYPEPSKFIVNRALRKLGQILARF